MTKLLTEEAVAGYRRNGYHFPIEVLTEAETRALRSKLEAYERSSGGPIQGGRVVGESDEYRGPVWLTGGLFGPESSIVTIVMLAVTVAAMLYWAKRRNRLIGGAARRVDTLKPLQPEARHA